MNQQTKRATAILQLLLLVHVTPAIVHAQFLDSFDDHEIEGWDFYTGDGDATVDFVQKDGFARILVDATNDTHNVWWAIIKRDVSSALDLSKLKDPDVELRVEARVRVSHAPRRLNFMINTQRTTNFHEHLVEHDIPDTADWHTISMTTKSLDAVAGDALNVQLGVTDWGLGKYHVDVDYYRADIVDVKQAGPDKGEPLLYHPPVPDVGTFTHHIAVTHDALIHSDFPEVNFNDWHVEEDGRDVPVLTVGANQYAVLRWDFGTFAGAKAEGAAVLQLSTHSVLNGGAYSATFGEDLGMEFGKVRVVEILGGHPQWQQSDVTYSRLLDGHAATQVFNGQMVFDVALSEAPGATTFITISRPVLQRLLDGTSKGLLIKPLGALNASFYASETGDLGPELHLNVQQ